MEYQCVSIIVYECFLTILPQLSAYSTFFNVHFAKIVCVSWHFHPEFFIQYPKIHIKWCGQKHSYCRFLKYVQKTNYNITCNALANHLRLFLCTCTVSGLTALSWSQCGTKYFKSEHLQQNLLSAWAHKYSAHASLSAWHIPFLLVWTMNVKKPSAQVTRKKQQAAENHASHHNWTPDKSALNHSQNDQNLHFNTFLAFQQMLHSICVGETYQEHV